MVREGVKAGLAVIAADAAVAHPAKGQRRTTHMHHRFIDASAAGTGAIEQVALGLGIFREHIQRQGFGAAVHLGDRLIQLVVGQHRQNGPKNFIGHHGAVPIHIGEDCGSNVTIGAVVLAAQERFPRLQQRSQAIKLAIVNNSPKIPALSRIGSIKCRDRPAQLGQQLRHHRPIDQKIIRCDASLARVEEFAPSDPLRRDRQIGIRRHKARTLAPQLQGDRREVLGRRCHHNAPNGRPTREENMVKLVGQQGLAGDSIPFKHRHKSRVKGFPNQGCHHCRRGRSHFRGFHDRAISRRDRPHQR